MDFPSSSEIKFESTLKEYFSENRSLGLHYETQF